MLRQLLNASPALRTFVALLLPLAARCLRPIMSALWFVLRPVFGLMKLPTPIGTSLLIGTATDLTRSRAELTLENALLRQQLVVLQRQVKRPRLTNTDRTILVLLAGKLRTWKSALLIVKPETLLRWHRAGFRLFWKRKASPGSSSHKPRLALETIALIKQMAQQNHLWGAERIRGELLKLNIRVAKRTIQKYMRQGRQSEPPERNTGQTWSTFLHNHAGQVWACDFLQLYDLFFRPLFIFIVIELGSRRVVHFRVTRTPTDEWTAQQLREATPYGEVPKYLIRDNDAKFGASFRRVAAVSGIKEVRIAYKAPKMNAYCERFLGGTRRECLDQMIILGEGHLHRVLKEYVHYYNESRPHQGIGQAIPGNRPRQETEPTSDLRGVAGNGKIIAFPVLGGLHHDYRRAA